MFFVCSKRWLVLCSIEVGRIFAFYTRLRLELEKIDS